MKSMVFILLIFPLIINAQVSPFNKKEIVLADSAEIVFLIGGHFHGASTNTSGFPAGTLLGNLEMINDSKADFMVCLGDLFLSPEKDLQNYPRVFFDKLNMPLFNAVGNHDVENFDYNNHFGSTYLSFEIQNSAFVILDTELDNGDIEGEQLQLLKDVLDKNYNQVFVFAHRPIWSEEDETLKDVFKQNTSSGTNFMEEVLPLMKSSSADVFMFGGSLGGDAPFSFFYHKKAENLIYIATAIRNLPRDGILKVKIKESNVEFTPISLTGQSLNDIESYNLALWNKTDGSKSFNWRLVPLYIKNMVFHRYFWYGIFWTVFGGVSIWFLKKIWLRRKQKGNT